MPVPEATPWGTGTAGTYYFFDTAIATYGRAYAGGVLGDPIPGATPLRVVPALGGGMNVQVLGGAFRQSGIDSLFLGADVALTAADPTYPRIDYVSIWLDPDDTNHHLEVTIGVLDNSCPLPTVPIPSHRTPPVPNIVLAMVMVHPGMTEVLEEHIYDRRFFLPFQFTGSGNKLATAVLAVAATPAGNLVTWNSDRNVVNSGRALTSVGDLSGPAAAVDGEVALYDGVTGKLLKRGTGTGPARLTSGVLGIGATNLASEVTGDLSLANVMPAAAGSTLLGRGDAGAGDWQAVALGTNLAMSGTTLNATGGGGGAPTTSEYLVGAVDAGLSAERLVTNTPSITWDLATAGQAKAARAALTGDVTAAADANATTIAADAVTYAKMQNVSAASKLLGRGDSGSGDPQEITLGANLTMTGTTLAAAGGAGGGDFVGPAASADSEVVLFSGTTGKLGKRSTGTGVTRIASGVQSAAELSGDVTTSGSNAVTIGTNKVSNAMLAQMAPLTMHGNNTGGTSNVQNLSVADVLGMLGLSAVGGIRTVRLGSDMSVVASMTPTEVTGLQFTATGLGTFMVLYALRYQSTTAATGIRYGLNHSGVSGLSLLYNSMIAGASGAHDQDLMTAGALSGIAGRTIASDPLPVASVSVDTVNSDMLLWIFALIDVATGGDLELFTAGDVATGTTTTKAGSGAIMFKLG